MSKQQFPYMSGKRAYRMVAPRPLNSCDYCALCKTTSCGKAPCSQTRFFIPFNSLIPRLRSTYADDIPEQ